MRAAPRYSERSTSMSPMHELIHYTYFRSSAAFRTRIALNLKGLKPEQVFIHLRKNEQNAPSYLRVNRQGLVPALVVDGHAIGQSLAIIEYLDEVWPEPPLLPKDALGPPREERGAAGGAAHKVRGGGGLPPGARKPPAGLPAGALASPSRRDFVAGEEKCSRP